METIHERCAGLELHEKTVVACARTPAGTTTHTFGTMTADLPERKHASRHRLAHCVDLGPAGHAAHSRGRGRAPTHAELAGRPGHVRWGQEAARWTLYGSGG